jgi:McrBC 5-methylcytosine restriction system component
MKKGIQLVGSRLTLNPDLVFGNSAVGDVKYKLLSKDWKRSDLYQAVAFATGYRVSHAAIVAFSTAPEETPPAVKVGDVRLRPITWDCSPTTTPDHAAQSIVDQAAHWLADLLGHPYVPQ